MKHYTNDEIAELRYGRGAESDLAQIVDQLLGERDAAVEESAARDRGLIDANKLAGELHDQNRELVERVAELEAENVANEQVFYGVALRDPFFRKHVIAQLSAMGTDSKRASRWILRWEERGGKESGSHV